MAESWASMEGVTIQGSYLFLPFWLQIATLFLMDQPAPAHSIFTPLLQKYLPLNVDFEGTPTVLVQEEIDDYNFPGALI